MLQGTGAAFDMEAQGLMPLLCWYWPQEGAGSQMLSLYEEHKLLMCRVACRHFPGNAGGGGRHQRASSAS